MKMQILHQHRERETVLPSRGGRYATFNRDVIRKLSLLKRFEPNARMQLASPRSRVVISVQPLGEVLEKQRQGKEIVILGKAEHVDPKEALKEARSMLAQSSSRLERRRVTLGVRKKKRLDSHLSRRESGGWRLNKSVGHTTREQDADPINIREFVVTIEAFKKQIEDYAEKGVQAARHANNGGDGTPPADIFNPVIDENKLADCLYEIHSHFFGSKAKESLLNNCDEVRFAAYLFVLVEKEKLGCDHFERCKSDFFNFMNEKVLVVHKMEVTFRTFANRLSEMKGVCALTPQQLKAEPEPRDFDLRNFQKIADVFHNTPYFLDLKKLRG